jgi:hypothetical protein
MHQAHGGARLTLRLLFTVALIAMPMAVQALGLGRLTVNSGLDEPFSGQMNFFSDRAGGQDPRLRLLAQTLLPELNAMFPV